MITLILDAAALPFYAIGWLYGTLVRMARFAAVAVEMGIERGKHGTSGTDTETD